MTSAPRKMTGSLKILGLMLGTRIELTPPNLTLILRQRLDNVWGEVLFTFLACLGLTVMLKRFLLVCTLKMYHSEDLSTGLARHLNVLKVSR